MQSDPDADAPAERIKQYLYRPLDSRVIWYDTARRVFTGGAHNWSGCLVQRYGEEFARAIELDTPFLCAVSQPRRWSESRPLMARSLVDLHLFDRGVSVFPACFEATPAKDGLFSEQAPAAGAPTANLHPAAWEALKKSWSLGGDLRGEPARRLVRGLFHLTLCVAHAPRYQLDHQDALAHDWIHLPIPKNRETFQALELLGETIAKLLDPLVDPGRLMRDLLATDRRTLAVPSTLERRSIRDGDLVVTITYNGAARGGWQQRAPREKEASRPAWGETTGDLFLNGNVFLANVPERVWRYELGGYPVIKKWLGYRDEKRRSGRPLTGEELDHLRSMVHRIAALLLLHEKLDDAYERAIEDPFTTEELGV
jgi:hypothetical protein